MEQNVVVGSTNNLKLIIAKNYQKQINNYFGNEKKALKFLSSVVSSAQRNPELLKCDSASVINSFMVMAQLELMPSDVSGEAYVIPYKGKAKFQLGYQGLVTLFYRAGVKAIFAEIIYKNDKFSYKNGIIEHEPDIFSEDRGDAIGAYVIVELNTGGKISKVMKKSDIINIGEKFSKSYNTEFTPWKQKNDPELWMWKKTVLIQTSKLVPKNEAIQKAIGEDYKDSNIKERVDKRTKEAYNESEGLKMGNLLKENKDKKNEENNDDSSKGSEEPAKK